MQIRVLLGSAQRSLEAAVEAAVAFLSKAVKPVLVGGVKLRAGKARKQFLELADASRYPVAVMPNAKGCARALVRLMKLDSQPYWSTLLVLVCPVRSACGAHALRCQRALQDCHVSQQLH